MTRLSHDLLRKVYTLMVKQLQGSCEHTCVDRQGTVGSLVNCARATHPGHLHAVFHESGEHLLELQGPLVVECVACCGWHVGAEPAPFCLLRLSKIFQDSISVGLASDILARGRMCDSRHAGEYTAAA